MLEKLNMERPEYGFYARAQIHDSPRPKPAPEPKPVYDDLPNKLPDDAEQPRAKYGSRFFWLN